MAGFLPTSRANRPCNIELYDVFCASAAPWLAFALRDPRFLEPGFIDQAIIYSGVSLLVGITILIWSGVGNIISRYFSAADCYTILRAAFTSASVTSMVAFFITRLDTIPRSLPIIHFLILGSILIAGRLVRARLTLQEEIDRQKMRSREDKNIIVVGANHVASFYIRLIDKFVLGHQRVLAVVDPNPRLRNRTLAGRQVIGAPEDLPNILREYKTHGIEIHKLVIAIDKSRLSLTALECLHSSISAGQQIDIEFIAERLGLTQHSSKESSPREMDVALQSRVNGAADVLLLQNRRYWKLKRATDIVVAGSLLVILAPVLAVVALAVRLGIGSPVIFWQRRVGRLGAGVFVFKFRTLLAPFDAQVRLRDESARLPRIGAFLRRTRLDELPQLLNILRGEMSLIGPRPLLPVDQPPDVGSRLAVPPGITGWAQVHGGNLITPDEKNALDEYYIRNASFWLDLKILLKTALILFTGDRRQANGGARAEAASSDSKMESGSPKRLHGAPPDQLVTQIAA
jgi:lipopolysaccharide/colanic/teichoic acid biosynthesis glycosyltransferase